MPRTALKLNFTVRIEMGDHVIYSDGPTLYISTSNRFLTLRSFGGTQMQTLFRARFDEFVGQFCGMCEHHFMTSIHFKQFDSSKSGRHSGVKVAPWHCFVLSADDEALGDIEGVKLFEAYVVQVDLARFGAQLLPRRAGQGFRSVL